MTAQSPEPQHLKSWQDAFQFPIPTVRRVEQELRRDIANNKEKLRALVGLVELPQSCLATLLIFGLLQDEVSRLAWNGRDYCFYESRYPRRGVESDRCWTEKQSQVD